MNHKNYFMFLSILIVVCFIFGCVPTHDVVATPESIPLVLCPETRPQICTRDYRPVCGELKDGSLKTYSNGCESCADVNVIGYRDGECAASSKQQVVNFKNNQTFVFYCENDYRFVTHIEGDRAWLFLPSETLALMLVSPGVFEAKNHFFRIDEERQTAVLMKGDGVSYQCKNNRREAIWEHAKLNGADFRAVGNEPCWNLEISAGSRAVLVTEYGEKQYRFDFISPQPDQKTQTAVYISRSADPRIILKIKPSSCADPMSGEAFESTVEVDLGGKILRGCGRALH